MVVILASSSFWQDDRLAWSYSVFCDSFLLTALKRLFLWFENKLKVVFRCVFFSIPLSPSPFVFMVLFLYWVLITNLMCQSSLITKLRVYTSELWASSVFLSSLMTKKIHEPLLRMLLHLMFFTDPFYTTCYVKKKQISYRTIKIDDLKDWWLTSTNCFFVSLFKETLKKVTIFKSCHAKDGCVQCILLSR